jgi:hypothetical protein
MKPRTVFILVSILVVGLILVIILAVVLRPTPHITSSRSTDRAPFHTSSSSSASEPEPPLNGIPVSGTIYTAFVENGFNEVHLVSTFSNTQIRATDMSDNEVYITLTQLDDTFTFPALPVGHSFKLEYLNYAQTEWLTPAYTTTTGSSTLEPVDSEGFFFTVPDELSYRLLGEDQSFVIVSEDPFL